MKVPTRPVSPSESATWGQSLWSKDTWYSTGSIQYTPGGEADHNSDDERECRGEPQSLQAEDASIRPGIPAVLPGYSPSSPPSWQALSRPLQYLPGPPLNLSDSGGTSSEYQQDLSSSDPTIPASETSRSPAAEAMNKDRAARLKVEYGRADFRAVRFPPQNTARNRRSSSGGGEAGEAIHALSRDSEARPPERSSNNVIESITEVRSSSSGSSVSTVTPTSLVNDLLGEVSICQEDDAGMDGSVPVETEHQHESEDDQSLRAESPRRGRSPMPKIPAELLKWAMETVEGEGSPDSIPDATATVTMEDIDEMQSLVVETSDAGEPIPAKDKGKGVDREMHPHHDEVSPKAGCN